MRIIDDLKNYSEYLKDESLLEGDADRLVFCHDTMEVEKVVRSCYSQEMSITIQGGLTGICGGAVPQGGLVLNLSEMNKILGMNYNREKNYYSVCVEAGILLKEFNEVVRSRNMDTSEWTTQSQRVYQDFVKDTVKMFPTDPTENLATLGGMVACEASGACSYGYGSIRKYIESICVVTPQKTVTIRRGQYKYSDYPMVFDVQVEELPKWHEHNNQLKDVVGLYYHNDMDLIDLFIGGEGILGVITEIEVRLIERQPITFGLMLFFNKDNKMVEFIQWLRNNQSMYKVLCAMEYFDQRTFELMNQFREEKAEIRALPLISKEYDGGIYLEYHLTSEEQLDDIMEQLWNQLSVYGINNKEQWLGFESSDYNKLKKFRHAIPECVNIILAQRKKSDNRLHKIGTDMAVLDKDLEKVLKMYEEDMCNDDYEGIIFGHIGNNHLHVNIIPKTFEQSQAAKERVNVWAQQVSRLQGSVVAEHGVGKLKKPLIHFMLNTHDLDEMKRLKETLEPKGLMNRGTLL